MTNKEFKRLSRPQLIDIIYQLQVKQDELTAENERLKEALADKRLRVRNAGNLAEAALEIHHVMQSAQDAAAHYLEEIQVMHREAEEECRRLLEKTQKDAENIIALAREGKASYNAELEAIMKEFRPRK